MATVQARPRNGRRNEAQTKFAKFAEEQDKEFIERVPEFADKEKAAELQSAAIKTLKNVGFTEDELAKHWNGQEIVEPARCQNAGADSQGSPMGRSARSQKDSRRQKRIATRSAARRCPTRAIANWLKSKPSKSNSTMRPAWRRYASPRN